MSARSLIQRLSTWRAERRTARPERVQRRAEAKARLIEHKRDADKHVGGGGG